MTHLYRRTSTNIHSHPKTTLPLTISHLSSTLITPKFVYSFWKLKCNMLQQNNSIVNGCIYLDILSNHKHKQYKSQSITRLKNISHSQSPLLNMLINIQASNQRQQQPIKLQDIQLCQLTNLIKSYQPINQYTTNLLSNHQVNIQQPSSNSQNIRRSSKSLQNIAQPTIKTKKAIELSDYLRKQLMKGGCQCLKKSCINQHCSYIQLYRQQIKRIQSEKSSMKGNQRVKISDQQLLLSTLVKYQLLFQKLTNNQFIKYNNNHNKQQDNQQQIINYLSNQQYQHAQQSINIYLLKYRQSSHLPHYKQITNLIQHIQQHNNDIQQLSLQLNQFKQQNKTLKTLLQQQQQTRNNCLAKIDELKEMISLLNQKVKSQTNLNHNIQQFIQKETENKNMSLQSSESNISLIEKWQNNQNIKQQTNQFNYLNTIQCLKMKMKYLKTQNNTLKELTNNSQKQIKKLNIGQNICHSSKGLFVSQYLFNQPVDVTPILINKDNQLLNVYHQKQIVCQFLQKKKLIQAKNALIVLMQKQNWYQCPSVDRCLYQHIVNLIEALNLKNVNNTQNYQKAKEFSKLPPKNYKSKIQQYQIVDVELDLENKLLEKIELLQNQGEIHLDKIKQLQIQKKNIKKKLQQTEKILQNIINKNNKSKYNINQNNKQKIQQIKYQSNHTPDYIQQNKTIKNCLKQKKSLSLNNLQNFKLIQQNMPNQFNKFHQLGHNKKQNSMPRGSFESGYDSVDLQYSINSSQKRMQDNKIAIFSKHNSICCQILQFNYGQLVKQTNQKSYNFNTMSNNTYKNDRQKYMLQGKLKTSQNQNQYLKLQLKNADKNLLQYKAQLTRLKNQLFSSQTRVSQRQAKCSLLQCQLSILKKNQSNLNNASIAREVQDLTNQFKQLQKQLKLIQEQKSRILKQRDQFFQFYQNFNYLQKHNKLLKDQNQILKSLKFQMNNKQQRSIIYEKNRKYNFFGQQTQISQQSRQVPRYNQVLDISLKKLHQQQLQNNIKYKQSKQCDKIFLLNQEISKLVRQNKSLKVKITILQNQTQITEFTNNISNFFLCLHQHLTNLVEYLLNKRYIKQSGAYLNFLSRYRGYLQGAGIYEYFQQYSLLMISLIEQMHSLTNKKQLRTENQQYFYRQLELKNQNYKYIVNKIKHLLQQFKFSQKLQNIHIIESYISSLNEQ